MANTYTQLYVQFVFSVKDRENLIKEKFRNELEKEICGIISNNKSKTYAIYCNPDHTHVFVGMHPAISPSKLMEQVKSGSSNWMNEKKVIPGKFSWQDGFGAFTYSKSHIDKVVKYILNQPKHHRKQSFREEYLSFLEKFEVDYDPNYLFEWYAND
ncbi:IS200/IS605 family transposase [Microbacter margulisiae]|uniref:REP element-mobilizing transposase RayT n=1 Tax=Microbacter margulisiae TaxID=1350067 RepID=A0A7W5DTN2_9PORP|nr:IS200/IS605 family transposase [Microbacter margulisiae]MBB3188520.1 REP element-mobilizing transposase RayT [Microbacter margulisiae]